MRHEPIRLSLVDVTNDDGTLIISGIDKDGENRTVIVRLHEADDPSTALKLVTAYGQLAQTASEMVGKTARRLHRGLL